MTWTCRCPICGAKDSNSNTNRRMYAKHGVRRDEHNRSWELLSKKEERRLLRTRMNREWKRESKKEAP